MNEIQNEELLSALLDGELSPTDEAGVRAMLAENPAAQQLFEELKGLRMSLQALPRHRLSPDFNQQVLRRAEREMLVGGATAASDGRAAAPVRPAGPAFNWSRLARPLMFSGLAVAAALVLMFITTDRLHENANVALNPTSTEPLATTPPADAAPATRPALSVPPAVAEPPASAKAGGEMVAKQAPRNRIDESALNRDAQGQTALGVAQVPADGAPDPTNKPDAPVRRALTRQQAFQYLANTSRLKTLPGASLVVIQVALTPEALRSQEFEQILRANEVHFTETGDAAAPEGPTPEEAEQEDVGEDNPVFDTGVEPARTDLVFVEATESQLDATLADMAAMPDAFANVIVAENAQDATVMQNQWQADHPGASAAPGPSGEGPLEVEAQQDREIEEPADAPLPQPPGERDLDELERMQQYNRAARNFGRRGRAQRITIPAAAPAAAEGVLAEQRQDAAPAAAQPAPGEEAEGAPQQSAVQAPPADPHAETPRRALFVLHVVPRNLLPPEVARPQTVDPEPAAAPQKKSD